MPDLHDLLTDAAASPRRPLDGQAVVAAAEGRLRRRRQHASGIAAVAVIGLFVGVALNLPAQEQAVVLDDPNVEQEGATDGAAEAVVDGSSGRFERVVLEGVELWRHAEPSGDDLEAEIVGIIEHDDDCGVQLRQEDSGVRHPVVWPDGTTLTDADPVTLRLPDGTTATVGQRVSGGGGYHPLTELFPDGCTGAGETAVFNASMPVMVADPTDPTDPADPADPDATLCIPDDVGDAPAIHDIVEVCVATGPQANVVAYGGGDEPDGNRWDPAVAITIEFAEPDDEPGEPVPSMPRRFMATATTDGVPNDEAGVGSRDGDLAEWFGRCGTADDWAHGTIDGTLVSFYGPQSCFPPGTHELTISSGNGSDTVSDTLRFTIPG